MLILLPLAGRQPGLALAVKPEQVSLHQQRRQLRLLQELLAWQQA
jgi:hypothetical protein